MFELLKIQKRSKFLNYDLINDPNHPKIILWGFLRALNPIPESDLS